LPDFHYELCNLTLPEPAKVRDAVLSRLALLALNHTPSPRIPGGLRRAFFP
jgi:hypothetical protein